MPRLPRFIGIVAEHYGVDTNGYRKFRSPAGGRDLAAYLCRRYSRVTLRSPMDRQTWCVELKRD